jgi:hypothetical protein
MTKSIGRSALIDLLFSFMVIGASYMLIYIFISDDILSHRDTKTILIDAAYVANPTVQILRHTADNESSVETIGNGEIHVISDVKQKNLKWIYVNTIFAKSGCIMDMQIYIHVHGASEINGGTVKTGKFTTLHYHSIDN